MNALTLDVIRNCFEGFVPSVIATCDSDGTPNVSLISQVHYVDPVRVALSYQFFNKTRRNVLLTKSASVAVIDPVTMAQFRLSLGYEETQTSGPLFESMKAKLSGIASHTGMQGVFRLLGADVYRVRTIEPIPSMMLPPPPAARNVLSAARRTCSDLLSCKELGDLLDKALASLQQHFGIEHAMVLMLDEAAGRLYTVASRGYSHSGIGSEVTLGEGVVGVAAREGVPIRIGHMTSEYGYGAAIRENARLSGMTWTEATEIPFPGLKEPHSQIALPILRGNRVTGVLLAESVDTMQFLYDDEDALALVAGHLGALIDLVQQEEISARSDSAEAEAVVPERCITIRHYQADDSIFLDHDYLIKGVAGAIFWKIVREYAHAGRVEFSNRELRLDPVLRLPEHAENLEARLVLLHKRLGERSSRIRIEKCGRGRFRLAVSCKLFLEDVSAGSERASPALATF